MSSSNAKDNEQGDGLTDQPQPQPQQQQQQQQQVEEEQKQEEGKTSGIDDKGKQPMVLTPYSPSSPEYSTSSFGTESTTDDDDMNPSSSKKRKLGPPPIVIEYWTESPVINMNETLKDKAEQLQFELEIFLPGIDVKINPELPIKNYNGLFRVRTESTLILEDYGDQSNPSSDDLGRIVPTDIVLKVKQLYENGII